jgi:Rrf2 family protein
MRTLSKKTQYGMKAMVALARRYDEGPILISMLAREELIPIKFLEGILLDLKTRGLLASKLGRKGGYRLSRPPSAITIGSIIRVIEGPLAPLPCASETAYHPCEDCVDVQNCGTRIVMRRVRDAISEVLDRTTLADVLAAVDRGRAQPSALEPIMYYI